MINYKYKILGILSIFISCFILLFILFISNGNNKEYPKNNISDAYDNIFIYSDFNNNISAFVNEDILIQMPVYDFGNNLSNEDLTININNLKEGQVKDISLDNKQVFDSFTSYTLSFYISFDKIGSYFFDDATVSITKNRNNTSYTIEKGIGKYNISIYDKDNNPDIEIVGGTALKETSITSDTIKNEYIIYPVEYRIKNNSNRDIVINDIFICDNNDIKIEIEPVTIEKYKEKVVKFNILMKGDILNSIIKPAIKYSNNANSKIFSATSIIIADPVPIDRLYELIKHE